jgi:hypothetical protein
MFFDMTYISRDENRSTLNSGNAGYHTDLKIKIYKTVILPVILCGCETWSLTLRVFENRVLRKIYGPKWDEDGSWRKLRIDELHGLYSSSNNDRVIKSRRMRWEGHMARMGRVQVFTGF